MSPRQRASLRRCRGSSRPIHVNVYRAPFSWRFPPKASAEGLLEIFNFEGVPTIRSNKTPVELFVGGLNGLASFFGQK